MDWPAEECMEVPGRRSGLQAGRGHRPLALLVLAVLMVLAGLARKEFRTQPPTESNDAPTLSPGPASGRAAPTNAARFLVAVPSPEPIPPVPAKGIEAEDPPAMLVEDAGGVTPRQRKEFLVNGHEHLLGLIRDSRSRPWQVAQFQKGLLHRCVATLLYARGRAAFPSQLTEEESKWYSTNEKSLAEGRTIIAQDHALFEFSKGEFPEFDRAMELLDPHAVNEEALAITERLFERALATFESVRR